MGLEIADVDFSCIPAMATGRDQFISHLVFVDDKGLHGLGEFIVQYMFAGKHTRVMESQEEQRIGMSE